MYNYEIELKAGHEFKKHEGSVKQVETMKEVVALYKEWAEHVEVVFSIDEHNCIIDDVTEIVAELAERK